MWTFFPDYGKYLSYLHITFDLEIFILIANINSINLYPIEHTPSLFIMGVHTRISIIGHNTEGLIGRF